MLNFLMFLIMFVIILIFEYYKNTNMFIYNNINRIRFVYSLDVIVGVFIIVGTEFYNISIPLVVIIGTIIVQFTAFLIYKFIIVLKPFIGHIVGVSIFIFFIFGLIMMNRLPQITMDSNGLNIKHFVYHDYFEWNNIESIRVTCNIPDYKIRLNGYSNGTIKIGTFQTIEGRVDTIYIDTNSTLYLDIVVEDIHTIVSISHLENPSYLIDDILHYTENNFSMSESLECCI